MILRLPCDDTLNKTKRGRDAGAYYRSHHEIDTVIGHSFGGAVALPLEQKYKKEGNNPYGITQSKTSGAPTVSGNVSNPLLTNIVKDEIVTAGAAGMGYIGASVDFASGFSDGGLLIGLVADIGKRYQAILLIELHQILIQVRIEYDILGILFLLWISMQPQPCPHLNKDGTTQHIHTQVYS